MNDPQKRTFSEDKTLTRFDETEAETQGLFLFRIANTDIILYNSIIPLDKEN